MIFQNFLDDTFGVQEEEIGPIENDLLEKIKNIFHEKHLEFLVSNIDVKIRSMIVICKYD